MSNQEKYYGGKYDFLKISGVSKVILKQKSLCDDIIYIMPIKEFFDKIDEQHKVTGGEIKYFII